MTTDTLKVVVPDTTEEADYEALRVILKRLQSARAIPAGLLNRRELTTLEEMVQELGEEFRGDLNNTQRAFVYELECEMLVNDEDTSS